MKCEVGPIERRIGGNGWFVYGCNDGESFVVVTKDGNPAAPFYFLVHRNAGKVSISGEGNGDKQAGAAANEELKALGSNGLAKLNDAVRRPAKIE